MGEGPARGVGIYQRSRHNKMVKKAARSQKRMIRIWVLVRMHCERIQEEDNGGEWERKRVEESVSKYSVTVERREFRGGGVGSEEGESGFARARYDSTPEQRLVQQKQRTRVKRGSARVSCAERVRVQLWVHATTTTTTTTTTTMGATRPRATPAVSPSRQPINVRQSQTAARFPQSPLHPPPSTLLGRDSPGYEIHDTI